MTYPTYDEWFTTLSVDQQKRVEHLVSTLRAMGANDAEESARSEVSDDIPQLARFLFLRRIWPEHIDSWAREPTVWIERKIQEAAKESNGHFADAGAALKRIISASVSVDDIGAVARWVAYYTTFSMLYYLGPPDDLEAPPDAPGWLLMEANHDGQLTGRMMGDLHDSLLSMDPSGREGRPVSGTAQ